MYTSPLSTTYFQLSVYGNSRILKSELRGNYKHIEKQRNIDEEKSDGRDEKGKNGEQKIKY